VAFRLYVLFILSWFLHLPARIPLLGAIRFDLLLICLILVLIFAERGTRSQRPETEAMSRILLILMAYVLLTLPVVEWPGSVLRRGMPDFIKAVVFYFFTVSLLESERRLRIFLGVFIVCQTLRILEPLDLHVTEGYWGSATYVEGGVMMNRLAGSPYDVINPNGLAFVITSVLPFYHYFCTGAGLGAGLLYILLVPICLYALVLTASRTGVLALLVIVAGIVIRSRRKILYTAGVILAAGMLIAHLTPLQRDRYLSITENDVRGASTARGRIEGVIENFHVALQRPIFGHGLGTSSEANYHALGNAQPAHNLYVEIWQELGIIGLVIFLFFINALVKNYRFAAARVRAGNPPAQFLNRLVNALQVWLWMNILFSFASYGLSSYEWYLFGGLSVVVRRLSSAPQPKDD